MKSCPGDISEGLGDSERFVMTHEIERDFAASPAAREIAAEASSAFAHGPSYEELWGRPKRGAVAPAPAPRPDRWPIGAAIVAVVIGAAALIAMRDHIVRALPPAAGAFRIVGLPVNLAGLELRGVTSRIVMDGARKVLAVEGEIVNLRREPNRVPAMSLAVRGENGLDRYAWTAPPPKARLEAGETTAFRARLASPPDDGAEVLVRFARLDETAAGKPKAR